MPFLYPCVRVPSKLHKAAPESSSLYALELGVSSVLNRKVLGPWQQLGQTNAGPVRVSVSHGRGRSPRGQREAALRKQATMWPPARPHTGPDTRP